VCKDLLCTLYIQHLPMGSIGHIINGHIQPSTDENHPTNY
jgi:hypothetical protein